MADNHVTAETCDVRGRYCWTHGAVVVERPRIVRCPDCDGTGFTAGTYSATNPAGVCLRCKGEGRIDADVADQLDQLRAAAAAPIPDDPPYQTADDRTHVRFDHQAYTHEHGTRHRTSCKCGRVGPWRTGTEPIEGDWRTLHEFAGDDEPLPAAILDAFEVDP